MLNLLLWFAALAFVTNAQQCSDCSGIACPAIACNPGERPVYVGCNCCITCVRAIGLYQGYCNVAIEPQPGGPTGPNGYPRVWTTFPICDVGLRCDPYSLLCVPPSTG